MCVITTVILLFFSSANDAVVIGAHDIQSRNQGNPVSYPFSAAYRVRCLNFFYQLFWYKCDKSDSGLVLQTAESTVKMKYSEMKQENLVKEDVTYLSIFLNCLV